MNKIDLSIVNNLKLEYIDEKDINLDIIDLLYRLYRNNLIFDPNNYNYFNKDRVFVSPKLTNMHQSILKLFYKDTENIINYKIDNAFGVSLGVALGNRYLNGLAKIEDNKTNLITSRTFCICKYDELLNNNVFNNIFCCNNFKLNKMVYIVVKDNYDKCAENLTDRLAYLKFHIEEVNGLSKLENILDDTKTSKIPTIIFVNIRTKNVPKIKENVNVNDMFDSLLKRLNKDLEKSNLVKQKAMKDLKLQEIINFLENKKVINNFKASNIKLNDDYEEKIIQSNQKIFNIFSNKNAFILNLSDREDIQTLSKSLIMDNTNVTHRNIILPNQINLLNDIAIGLAILNFKVFISSKLNNMPHILDSIIESANNNLDIHYTFLEDDNVINYIDLLNCLDNLICFRPGDINEVIGVYEILNSYSKTTVNIISNKKVKALKETNYKYVQAGSYPVKKESDTVNGILIASGYNVNDAITIVKSLISLGIVLRVVSMPSLKVFDMQNKTYQEKLLIPSIKTFILDAHNQNNYKRFVKNNEFILNSGNIEIDKAKIIELMKK